MRTISDRCSGTESNIRAIRISARLALPAALPVHHTALSRALDVIAALRPMAES
jgi:hypothetical protein